MLENNQYQSSFYEPIVKNAIRKIIDKTRETIEINDLEPEVEE